MAFRSVVGVSGLRQPCVRERHCVYLMAEETIKVGWRGINERFEMCVWEDSGVWVVMVVME